MRKKQGFEC